MTVGDLLDHQDNPLPPQLCLMNLFLGRLGSILDVLDLLLLLLQLGTTIEPHWSDMEVENCTLAL